jgi:hypothetical protein
MREKWGKWSDLQLVNILVSLDTKKSRIIYSEVIQLFEIIQYQATEENDTDVVRIITEMIVLFHNQETAG